MMIGMNWRTSLTAVTLSLALAACSGDGGPADDGSGNGGFVRVSPRDSRYFELADGTPFIPIGLNIAYPRFLLDERSVYQKMDERLGKLAANGGNFVCIWMGHPFYDVEHAYAGKLDSLKIERIDRIIELARKHGIRVKLTFDHFRTLEEIPPRFAGAVSRGKSIYHVSRGGPAKNMTEFFTLDKSKSRYKRKLAWFAKRYRDEPAVFAWELWNGIDAVAGSGWQEWTREMLAELHAQFPNHLAVQSLGALDMFRKRFLYEPIWKMTENDFAQVHRYLDLGAEIEACKGPADVMAADAVRSVRTTGVAKPIILAESGAVEPGHAGPWKLYEQDRVGTVLHDIIFSPFFAGAAGSGQSWHWNFYVDRHDLWRHFGYFAELVKDLDPPAEMFQPGELEHERLRIYTLTGKKTFLAWCRDKDADWRAELETGRVEPLNGAVVDLSALEGGAPQGQVRLYNPWAGNWEDCQLENGKLKLPAILRSTVVRIDG